MVTDTGVDEGEDADVSGHVEVRAYAELNDFLGPAMRGTTVRRPFRSHQTVKDVIEALGIPHTEVDLILADAQSVGFSHRPSSGVRLAVYPVFESLDIGPVGRLRPTALRDPRFVVDVNLGRLARLLRLVGFDVRYDRHLDDGPLADIGDEEHRIVLTRDRSLLKRRQVTQGDRAPSAMSDLARPITFARRCGVCPGSADRPARNREHGR